MAIGINVIRFLDWLNSGSISPADIGISMSYDKENTKKEMDDLKSSNSGNLNKDKEPRNDKQ